MRPGNLEDFGWNKIARDFDRAIALARLSGIQSALVQAAREASWTEASMKGEDPRPFKLSPRGLAKIIGCAHSNVILAQDELVRIGIFRRLEDGSYIINKDYRLWIKTGDKHGGQPLFSPEQLAHIMQPKRRKSARTGSASATNPVAPALPLNKQAVAPALPTGSAHNTTPVAPALPPPPGAVIGTRGIEEREREIEREEAGSWRAHTGTREEIPLHKTEEFKTRLHELEQWHADTHPSDMLITTTHLTMLLVKAPDHPEWVKEAIEDGLLKARRSPAKYAMVRLTDRIADPDAWTRKQESLAAGMSTGPAERLTPHQLRERAQVEALRARFTQPRKANQ